MHEFLPLIPNVLLDQSGLVFYSGRSAFSQPSAIYLLGANPGGDRGIDNDEFIGAHSKMLATQVDDIWSSYKDGVWGRKGAGQETMQLRIAHMFDQLGLDLRSIPASNLIFTRSRNVAALGADFEKLADMCWPVHQAVITKLKPKIILCMGNDAAGYVRNKLAAFELVDHYIENNNRGWKSEAHRNNDGKIVITVTHPSRADWRNPNSDPTPLVKKLLASV